MGIGMTRHRQLIALKHMCRQREYLVHIPGIMERDTHGGSEEGGVRSEEAEEREDHLIIEIEDTSHLLDGLSVVCARAPDLIHVSYGFLCEFMHPDRVLLHREDIDIDTLLLPDTVVAVLLQHPRTLIAYFGIEVEVVRIGIIVL
jgi:hypothetical protein